MRHSLPAVLFLLPSLATAQAPAPAGDWLARTVAEAPPMVRVAAVLHEPITRLAPRFAAALTAAERDTVDGVLRGSSGLGAVLERLADHVGPQSVWFLGMPFVGQTVPAVAVSLPIGGPGARDAVQRELEGVANGMQQVEGARAWNVQRNGSERTVFEVAFRDANDAPAFVFEVTADTLRIGTSSTMLLFVGRDDVTTGPPAAERFRALVATPVPEGRARLVVDLGSSQDLRAWLVRATARARGVQSLLDVLGGGVATLDLELDAIDRFATLVR